jgi:hypothetical protein
VKTWYSERDNFTYGSPNNDLHVVGHYTQMVWGATHRVGCGFARCHAPHNVKEDEFIIVTSVTTVQNVSMKNLIE